MMQDQPPTPTRACRPRPRFRFRLSVRAMMVLVLVLGAGLGWVVHRARVQREAVAAIERDAGRVFYEWDWSPLQYTPAGRTFRPKASGTPDWPRPAIDALGIDYFGDVKKVVVRRNPDALMAEQIGRLGRLAELEFAAVARVSDAGLTHLRGLSALESLHVDSTRVTAAALAHVSGLSRLRSLHFFSEDPRAPGPILLDDSDLHHLSGLTALEDLHLQAGGMASDTGLAYLKDLVRLRHLSLGGRRITAAGLDQLRGMTQLSSLSIVFSNIDDLSPIRPPSGLRTLRIAHCPLTDAGLAPIAGLVSLQGLSLQGTRIGDAGLAHLEGLSSLKDLDLSGTGITDAGLAHLRGLPILRSLDLRDTRVTDAGLDQLVGMGRLNQVRVSGSRVTPRAMARFRRAHPGINVVR